MECGREGSSNCPFVPAFALSLPLPLPNAVLLVRRVDMRANEVVM